MKSSGIPDMVRIPAIIFAIRKSAASIFYFLLWISRCFSTNSLMVCSSVSGTSWSWREIGSTPALAAGASVTSWFSLSGLNFAIGVLFLIEPYGFVLDSPTFSTASTVCVTRKLDQLLGVRSTLAAFSGSSYSKIGHTSDNIRLVRYLLPRYKVGVVERAVLFLLVP